MASLSQFPIRLSATDAPSSMKWKSMSSLGDLSCRSSGRLHRQLSADDEEAVSMRRRAFLQCSAKSSSSSRLLDQGEQFQPSDETVNRVLQKYKSRLGKCEKKLDTMKEETNRLKSENKKQQVVMEGLSQDYRRVEEQLQDSRERESTQGAMVLQLRVMCESYESQINKLQKENSRKTDRLDKEKEMVRRLRAELEETKRENMRLKVEKMNRSNHVVELARIKSDTTLDTTLSDSPCCESY
mmetsp:Transcript_26980/g.39451  ORF Transcript_26980/g.39451 Transcript_26980/m.39451 type:complete len:241 (-) Transcript_26980:181-903(-)|eukprot:CAMPEP_0194031108 /NCGR_PEP_ID=MMETSP0009_2-20130614/4364_1 /TAXON_ID=210454 /ORGANISM="Grammatophora oceanica, Strain CCMP 410" /LENGTH=240 /DNA_ID=CAMNT_0038671177 /DNA_START=61 /DNA_END=783 /DNA_ORIENTATION=-